MEFVGGGGWIDGPIEAIDELRVKRRKEAKPYFQNKVVQPALTKVCRQLRKEVLPIFYGQNVFVVVGNGRSNGIARAAQLWLHAIGSKNRGALRQFYVLCWNYTLSRNMVKIMEDFEDELVVTSAKEMRKYSGKFRCRFCLKHSFNRGIIEEV